MGTAAAGGCGSPACPPHPRRLRRERRRRSPGEPLPGRAVPGDARRSCAPRGELAGCPGMLRRHRGDARGGSCRPLPGTSARPGAPHHKECPAPRARGAQKPPPARRSWSRALSRPPLGARPAGSAGDVPVAFCRCRGDAGVPPARPCRCRCLGGPRTVRPRKVRAVMRGRRNLAGGAGVIWIGSVQLGTART